jgi:hypothetical protein
LSALAARMLVIFLARQTFTSMSLSRQCSPTICPAYTVSAGLTKNAPLGHRDGLQPPGVQYRRSDRCPFRVRPGPTARKPLRFKTCLMGTPFPNRAYDDNAAGPHRTGPLRGRFICWFYFRTGWRCVASLDATLVGLNCMLVSFHRGPAP